MNQMIENNIQEYPGDNITSTEFFNCVRCMFEIKKNKKKNFYFSIQNFIVTCEVYIPAWVGYIQELPGMKNISLKNLQKLINHLSFDWYLVRIFILKKNKDLLIIYFFFIA